MEDINNRFKRLIDYFSGGNLLEFSRLSGISNNTLYKYTLKTLPTAKTLFVLRKKFRINLNWFIAGEGEMFDHKEQGRVHAPEISPEILAEVLECFQEEFFPKSEMSPEIMADLIIRAYKKIVELIASRPEQKDDLRCDLTNTPEKVT